MVGQRDLLELIPTCKHKVGRLAASRQAGSIASCISVWLCCLYPPDVLVSEGQHVCAVPCFCRVSFGAAIAQAAARSKGPSAYRIQTA